MHRCDSADTVVMTPPSKKAKYATPSPSLSAEKSEALQIFEKGEAAEKEEASRATLRKRECSRAYHKARIVARNKGCNEEECKEEAKIAGRKAGEEFDKKHDTES